MNEQSFWWQEGVIYQIYPRSFADSNQDGIGDLNGITARLDYLQKLGITALWLSPIYPSPDVDFGYDVSDYNAIDPKFGSMADFDRLVHEAHQRGMRVILDLVLNHTSDQHAWFQQSRLSTDNPFRKWYLWSDFIEGSGAPNNWSSNFGGNGWKLDPLTNKRYFHMFAPEQPDLNWRHAPVRQAMLDIFRFWCDRGVDGFRLDVFNAYYKNSAFANNPAKFGLRRFDRQIHANDIDQPEMAPLLADIRAILDSYPERYAVGETFMGDIQRAVSYVGQGKLHAAFDFSLLNSGWSAGKFLNAILAWEKFAGEEAWPTYVLNNHDNKRSATRYTHDENDQRLKILAALLLTQRGTPFMYYGEEIGLRDIPVPYRQIKDRVGKYYWPFYRGRDGCRAPMQWDDSKNAGFSSVTPWQPVHNDYNNRNVAAQEADPTSLLNFYRRLIHFRQQSSALKHGLFLPLTFEPRTPLTYLRQDAHQTVFTALNFSRRPVNLVIGSQLSRGQWKLALSSHRSEMPEMRNNIIRMEPYESLILVQDEPIRT